MKNKIFGLNILYFLLLVLASVLSFFLIFGSGFVGELNFYIFLILGIMAVILTITYVWQIPFMNNQHRLLFSLSGIVIVYNVFLSTLFLDPGAIQSGWLFIGTPVVMLVIWYVLVHKGITKNITMHWLLWILFFVILLFYAWHITLYYYSNVVA